MPIYIVDAARLIDWRIRQYVPHRHTFMIWSMSASEGLGLGLSRAAACMICPGLAEAAMRYVLVEPRLLYRVGGGHLLQPGLRSW